MKDGAELLGKALAKAVQSVLRVVEELKVLFSKVVQGIKGAIKFVQGKLASLGERFGELLGEIGDFFELLLRNCHESKISCKWPKHHPWPQYLGGLREQTLKKIPRRLHQRFHIALDRWKGGKYDRHLTSKAFKNMDTTQIINDLREFYQTAEGGIFARYLPDFEQAVQETLKGVN